MSRARSPRRAPSDVRRTASDHRAALSRGTHGFRSSIFSPYGELPEAADFYRDVKARAAGHGRHPDDIKILPSASFMLGDRAAEARERHREVREQQITGQTALVLLEQVWNRDATVARWREIAEAKQLSLRELRRRRHHRLAPGAVGPGRVRRQGRTAAAGARLAAS